MLRLHAGDWTADLAPEDGAGLTALRLAGRDVLMPAPQGRRLGGPFGAFWMIPWANRLDGGRLDGHHLPINREQEGTAIHGLSRDRGWDVQTAAPDRVVLVQSVDAAPYRYDALLVVGLSPAGLLLDLTITNAGDAPMSFGAGWHPWFVRPAGTRLAFRATHRCVHDQRCMPVSAEPSSGLDGGEEVLLGLDTHFPGWDGVARLEWPGLALRLDATGALATNLQVFAPRDRSVLCVEPSSHLPDVVNRPAMAGFGPMRMLDPGAALAGTITLALDGSHRG